MSFYKKVPGLQRTLESELLFDKEPTAGSTNPVTSEGVNNGIGTKVTYLANSYNGDTTITIENPTEEYDVGRFYYFSGTFNLCTAYSASEATFQPYSICEALNFLKGLIEDLGE